MLCCRIFCSFVSCSTSRVCLGASLGRNVNHRRIFCAREENVLLQQNWVLRINRIRMKQRSHSASVGDKNLLTSSSRTLPWHVYKVSKGSYCVKTVLLIERHSDLTVIAVSQGLNFKSRDSLSALEPSDPCPTYIRKIRVLPFFSASV